MEEDESQKRHKLQYFDFTIRDRPTAVPQTILNKLAHDECDSLLGFSRINSSDAKHLRLYRPITDSQS
jgi:hypothetical protein